MLVLSRKPGESVQIGDSATLTVEQIKNRMVLLKIEGAPFSFWEGCLDTRQDFESGQSVMCALCDALDVKGCIIVLRRIEERIVRFGFDAPQSVVIARTELFEKA